MDMEHKKVWAVLDALIFNKIIETTAMESAIVLNKNGEIVGMNKAFNEMFNISPNINFFGKKWEDVCPKETEWRLFNCMLRNAIKNGGSYVNLSFSNKKRVWFIGKVYANNTRTRFSLHIGKVNDNLDNYKLLKDYDSLTMLPNREIYEKHFSLDSNMNTLILIDLKRFYLINENFGSVIGDKILVKVVEKLQNITELDYPLYRVTGNQFLIIVPQYVEKEIIDKINNSLSEEFSIGSKNIYVNFHMGVYRAEQEDDKQKAIYYVEDALWLAKKNSLPVEYYSKNVYTLNLLVMEHDLRKAIEENPEQFFVEYQMQYSIQNNNYCGAEALIRWNHPQRGRINPLEFLQIAHDLHLLPSVDKLVFQRIVKDLKIFSDSGKDFPISMNLSAQAIVNKEFQNFVLEALDEFKPNISFEITETDKIKPENCQFFLDELKKRNCFISIDDFGTGYASFEYIMNYPADCIKIDKTFIKDLESNERNQTIVSNIIKMSKGLNLLVVAEGAESASDVKMLTRFGCNVVQGFFYARPHTPEKILAGAVNI